MPVRASAGMYKSIALVLVAAAAAAMAQALPPSTSEFTIKMLYKEKYYPLKAVSNGTAGQYVLQASNNGNLTGYLVGSGDYASLILPLSSGIYGGIAPNFTTLSMGGASSILAVHDEQQVAWRIFQPNSNSLLVHEVYYVWNEIFDHVGHKSGVFMKFGIAYGTGRPPDDCENTSLVVNYLA